MHNSLIKRLLCTLLAGAVTFGSMTFPTAAMAEDIDEYLDDLDDLTDDEIKALKEIDDIDGDGDIDDDDIEAVETILTVAVLSEVANEVENEAKKQAQAEAKKKAEKERNKYVNVTGIYVSSTGVDLNPGQSFRISAHVKPDDANNQGVSYSSSNPSVASVDGSGLIVANNTGNCVVTSRSNENGFQAYTYVRVNPAPAVAAQTVASDAAWLAVATNLVTAAAPGGIVTLAAAKPMTFNSAFANALKKRPDVGVIVTYPYGGKNYTMAIPAGYNLSSKLDKSGNVSFLALAAAKDGIVVK